jgi:hypothetical protein
MGVQPARVQGVDLNLDEFNLSAPTDVAISGVVAKLDAGADISAAFWMNLEEGIPSMFSEEDRQLLVQVFNPALSDRRDEGDLFIPPDTSREYVQRLRALVQEEQAVHEQRMDRFFSKEFSSENTGPLFPMTWATNAEICRGDSGKAANQLHPRPDFVQMNMLQDALASAVPKFDKFTEDGSRFSIYRIGSLEVRTITEPDSEPVIGAVFSVHSPAEDARQAIKAEERISKATEYVEGTGVEFQVFAVFETEERNHVVVEQLPDGTSVVEENPTGLEDRISLAKVLRTSKCVTDKDVASVREGDKHVYSLMTGDEALSVLQMQ